MTAPGASVVPLVTAHLGLRRNVLGDAEIVLTLVAHLHGRTQNVSKHLLDETAEFKLPTLGRHAAAEPTDDVRRNDELDATQRFAPGFQRPSAHRDDDAGAL